MIGLCCWLLALYYYPGQKRFIAVWLLFFLATAGFQLMPVNWIILPKAGVSKPYDWVLIFTAAVFFFQPKRFLQSPVWTHFKWFIAFGALLIVLLCYSIFIRDIEVPVAVRVFRNFIIFIVLFLFVPLERHELQKVFSGIIYATTFASLVYCLQPLLHTGLLNRITTDMKTEGETITRYYNVPVFVYPVVFFLFYTKLYAEVGLHTAQPEPFGRVAHLRFRTILLLINLLAVLLTQHRNLIMAVAVSYFLYLILQHRMKLQHAIVYGALGAGLFLGADALMDKRFSKGVENLSTLSLNTAEVRYSEIALSDLSTTQFRQLILTERFQYIMQNETRAALGIGLMTDDSKKAKPLRFYIGMPDDEGNISQIANIDIAWASLLLQLGLPGTALFIILHLFLLKRFWQWREDSYLQVGILFIVSLFVTSFYGSMIAMPYIMALLMLFAAYYYRLSCENTGEENI